MAAERSETASGPDRGAWVLAATIIASSMAFIDMSVVNVALPVLQRSIGASFAEAQWVVEAYVLLLSALTLVGGALGDIHGRRRVFGIGILIFAIASACCGLATSPASLILSRVLQGIGGALMVPGSLACWRRISRPSGAARRSASGRPPPGSWSPPPRRWAAGSSMPSPGAGSF